MRENQKAKATVGAIIDGMGSLGAAFGPLISGFVSDYFVSFQDNFTKLFLVTGLESDILCFDGIMLHFFISEFHYHFHQE